MVRNQLIESAWAYQHRPAVGAGLKARQQQATSPTIARSWAAQQRLCGKHRSLSRRKDSKSVVNAAVARELAGFVWAGGSPNPDPCFPGLDRVSAVPPTTNVQTSCRTSAEQEPIPVPAMPPGALRLRNERLQ